MMLHINDVYGHMYMFRDSFYDMMARGDSMEVRAAIKLLEIFCAQGEPVSLY